MKLTLDQFVGCMVGLATGDALGAPYEGGPMERLVWRLLGKTSSGRMRWTDDTQMAIDLARSLLADGRILPDALASRFASSYRWTRGYGPGTAKVLKQIRRGKSWQTATRSVYPDGSYGNGAAMRAPVLGLYFAGDSASLTPSAEESAVVTHPHPLGMEAAIVIALATYSFLHGADSHELLGNLISASSRPEICDRLATAESWVNSNARPTPKEVASRLGNGVSAQTSCPTAVYIALRHRHESFDSMMRFTIACRGDVDTIGAMAGALWGASRGSSELPPIALESRDEIVNIGTQLFERYQHSAGDKAVNGSRR